MVVSAAEEAKSINAGDHAAQILDEFYDAWGKPGLKPRERQKELDHLADIVRRFGHDIAHKAARRLPELLKKRWPACLRLSGAWGFLDELVASEKAIADHAAKVEADRRKRHADTTAAEERAKAERRSREHLALAWSMLAPCEQRAIEAKVAAMAKLVPVGSRMFETLCYDEMARSPPPTREELGGIFATNDETKGLGDETNLVDWSRPGGHDGRRDDDRASGRSGEATSSIELAVPQPE